MKKRILWVGESSFLSTGFSQYSREILKRLYDTGKYEIAELGCFAEFGDRRALGLPWTFYYNAPNPSVPGEVENYSSRHTNEWGEFRFEETCLAFKPDIVCDARDVWHFEHQQRSPFKQFFKWVLMPTVDAEPQEEQWLSIIMSADAVLTYTDWSMEVLREQAPNSIKLAGSAPPGVDSYLEMTTDKRKHKEQQGMNADSLIIGTVMRNQERKLFPELIEAFAMFLKQAPEHISERAYLYLHTAYPDHGWDIPRLLNEQGVASRTLMTYHCKNCGHAFPSIYADAKAYCINCNQPAASLPTWHCGVSRKALCAAMNLFDVYIQYSRCEGFGLPMAEAAACGVPVMAVDYSAMSDVVRKLGGTPISVLATYREAQTLRKLAIPDNQFLVERLIGHFQLPESVRLSKGHQAREAALTHYSYDNSAQVWQNVLDKVECPEHDQTWGSPGRLHTPAMQVPSGMSDQEFIEWSVEHVAGRPDLVGSYMTLRMGRDLLWGVGHQGAGNIYANENSVEGAKMMPQEFTRETAFKQMLLMCEQRNFWEHKRVQSATATH